MTLAPGATVGRYQILAPLGQGGMATVYKAYQPSLDREVALKVLRPGYAQDKEFLERFEREAKSIAKLRHPNIVQVFDFEAIEGQYALAMEFLEGGTLKERLSQLAAQRRGLDPKEAARIVWEVADALSYAHELGIVHRDIKPSNVMLTRKDRAVVTDFGIARILGATSHTQTGVGIGTPEYMAPEQGQGGAIDHRADIYSLGAMAYELLVGRVPYVADTPLAVVLAHMKDPLPLPGQVNPTIGKAVERALLRALAKDREQRFSSAIAFAEALRDGLAEDARGGTVPTIVVRGAMPAATTAASTPGARSITIAMPTLTQRPLVLAGATLGALLALGGGAAVLGLFGTGGPATPGPTAAPFTTQPPAIARDVTAPPASIGAAAATSAAAATPTAPAASAAATPRTPVPTSVPAAAAIPASTPAPAVAAPTSAPTPLPTAVPTPAPTPLPPPKFAIPAKGMLLYQARLDGSSSDLGRVQVQNGAASDVSVTFSAGAIQLAVNAESVAILSTWNTPARLNSIIELELTAGRDSVTNYRTRLRGAAPSQGGGFISLDLKIGSGYGVFQFWNPSASSLTEISPRVSIPQLNSAAPITVAVVVDGDRYTLYVDQQQRAQITDGRANQPSAPTVELGGEGGVGSVRITGARVYALP